MPKKSGKSDKQKGKSRATHVEEAPVDPGFQGAEQYAESQYTDAFVAAGYTGYDAATYPADYSVDYSVDYSAHPGGHYYTGEYNTAYTAIDPSLLAYNDQGPSSWTLDPGPSFSHQDANLAQPSASSSSAETKLECIHEGCNGSFDRKTEYNKHKNLHDKPIKCEGGSNCPHATADKRDMDRHYNTYHKEYAREIGCYQEPVQCPQCKEYFTRPDNCKKHQNRLHH